MSLTITYRASVYSTGAATSYATATTYTPAANSLLVCFVLGCSTSVVDPNHATTPFSGHGVSWTKLTLTANGISTTHAISVWVANAGATPSSAACTAQWTANRTGAALIEFEITGWDDGSTPDAAIVQNPVGTGTGTTGTVNLSAAGNATNRPLSFFVHLANEATTFRTNWTETAGADGNFNSPATGAEAQFRSDAFETTSTATWAGSVEWRGVALEIKNKLFAYTITGAVTVSAVPAATMAYEPSPEIVGAVTVTTSVAARAFHSIPLTNLDSATLDTGENQIHGWIQAVGYLWGCTNTSPAKLVKRDPNDLSAGTTLTFASDGLHGNALDLRYIPAKDRLYTCHLSGSNKVNVAEVNPYTLAVVDVISQSGLSNIRNPESIEFDDTYLYVACSGTLVSHIRRYQLSDWAFVSEVTIPAGAHCIRRDGTKLFVTTTGSPGHLARIETSTFTIDEEADLPTGYNIITDDIAITASHIWVGCESGVGIGAVVRVSKTDLTSQTVIDLPYGAACYGVFTDGAYVFAVHNTTPGQITRLDTVSRQAYHFPSGQNSPNELLFIGSRGFATFFLSPAQVSSFNLNDVYPAGAIAGDVTVSLAVASAMVYAAGAAEIVGDVTVSAVPAAALDYQRNASISGSVTVSTSVAAALDYTRNAALAGSVTVTAAPAATLAYNRHPSIAGAVTVTAAPAATLDYTRNASITGAVTVTASVAASLDYTRHAAIAGAVSLSVSPAATLDYQRNASLAGAVTLSVTPAAALDFTAHPSIAGAVTVSTAVAAGLDYTRNASLIGSITVAAVPSSTLDYTRHASIVGAVTVSTAVASEMMFDVSGSATINGHVTVTLAVAATLDYTRHAAISGAVQVTALPAASLDYTRNASLAGTVTVTVAPSASLDYQRNASIAGTVTVSTAVAAALDYTRNASIAGSVPVSTAVASAMLYEAFNEGATITGDVTVTLSVSSALDYTRNASLAGSVSVGTSVASALAYNRHASIAGSAAVGTVVSSTMLFGTASAAEYVIVGNVTVSFVICGWRLPDFVVGSTESLMPEYTTESLLPVYMTESLMPEYTTEQLP